MAWRRKWRGADNGVAQTNGVAQKYGAAQKVCVTQKMVRPNNCADEEHWRTFLRTVCRDEA
eukprot:5659462-Lingulodinium_polyedra.AAC.1